MSTDLTEPVVGDPAVGDPAVDGGDPGQVETAGGGGEPEEITIRDYAKSILGDEPWLNEFKSDDDLLRSHAELRRKIGERDQAAATLKYLEDQGVTPAKIQQWKAAEEAAAKKSGVEWDDSWIAFGADGKAIPTAAGQAALGDQLPTRYAAHQQEVYSRLNDLPKLIEAAVAKHMPQLGAQAQQQVEAATQAQTEALSQQSFIDANKSVFFAGGTPDESGQNWTPLARRVGELVHRELNPAMPLQDRMKLALKLATAETTPKPATKPVPKGATHTASPASRATDLMSVEDFVKKYPNASLREHAAYFQDGGKLPGNK